MPDRDFPPKPDTIDEHDARYRADMEWRLDRLLDLGKSLAAASSAAVAISAGLIAAFVNSTTGYWWRAAFFFPLLMFGLSLYFAIEMLWSSVFVRPSPLQRSVVDEFQHIEDREERYRAIMGKAHSQFREDFHRTSGEVRRSLVFFGAGMTGLLAIALARLLIL